MRRKPQHVGNISSDAPYMLTFLCHIGHCLYINQSLWKYWKEQAVWLILAYILHAQKFHVHRINTFRVVIWKFCKRLRSHDWLRDNESINLEKYWLLSYPIMRVESIVDISHDSLYKKQLIINKKVKVLWT